MAKNIIKYPLVSDEERFSYNVSLDEFWLYEFRDNYIDYFGKNPDLWEYENPDGILSLIEHQFESKYQSGKSITNDDVLHVSEVWNFDPKNVLKVLQLGDKYNQLLEKETLDKEIATRLYINYDLMPDDEFYHVFYLRELAVNQLHTTPTIRQAALQDNDTTEDDIRIGLSDYFSSLFINSANNEDDISAIPFLNLVDKECSNWNFEKSDIEIIKSGIIDYAKELAHEIIESFEVNEKDKEILASNNFNFIINGKAGDFDDLSANLNMNVDSLKQHVIDIFSEQHFSDLEELEFHLQMWDFSEEEKRLIKFHTLLWPEEVYSKEKLSATSSALQLNIELLLEDDSTSEDFYIDPQVLILNPGEEKEVLVRSDSNLLQAVLVSGDYIDFYWSKSDHDNYLIIKGNNKGSSVLSIRNGEKGEMIHLPVIVSEKIVNPLCKKVPINADELLGVTIKHFSSEQLKHLLAYYFMNLSITEIDILMRHYGLPSGNIYSIKEIANYNKTSSGRIRQIEDRAIDKLIHIPVNCKSKKPEDIIDAFKNAYPVEAELIVNPDNYKKNMIKFLKKLTNEQNVTKLMVLHKLAG